MEQYLEYLTTAPIAVILFVYIILSDKRTNKIIKGAQEQNKELLELVEKLTDKLSK